MTPEGQGPKTIVPWPGMSSPKSDARRTTMPQQQAGARKTIGKDPLDALLGEGRAELGESSGSTKAEAKPGHSAQMPTSSRRPPRKETNEPARKEKLTVVLPEGL